jgi:6-phosphogluconolactonase (cycloisomerase 2 family)
LLESKNKWIYVANQGNNSGTTNSQSGISGYVIDPQQHTLSPIAHSPWGSGASPQCLIEDPSFQYIYTANFGDSTVTGRRIDQNAGVLNNLLGSANRSFPLTGPATYCLVTGRTS